MARGFDTTFGVGSSDSVSCAAFTSPTAMSFAGWYWRNGVGGLSSGRIFDKTGSAVAEINLNWRNTSSSIRFGRIFSTTSGGWDTTAAAAVAIGAWVHIVITYDGSSTSNNPTIYINGQSVSVTTTTAPVGTVANNSGVLVFGNRSTGSTQWDGMLGGQAFWSGCLLNQAEARALFQGADPRTIRPQYLAEYVQMHRERPCSTLRSTQPITTGTKFRADRLVAANDNRFVFARVQVTGPIGTSVETDTALSLVPVQIEATGAAVETDTALALSSSRPAGLATETDSALALTSGASAPVGQATETDTAIALAGVSIRAAGLSVETDSALSLGGVAILAVGVAASGETSLPLGSARPAATASENETALGLSPVAIRQCGTALEGDAALALLAVYLRLVGASTETDAALALSFGASSAVGRADETDMALALQASAGPTPPDRTVTSTRLRYIVGNARGTRAIVSPPRKRAA